MIGLSNPSSPTPKGSVHSHLALSTLPILIRVLRTRKKVQVNARVKSSRISRKIIVLPVS